MNKEPEEVKVRIKRVFQTLHTEVDADNVITQMGNCLQACIATVLKTDISKVPHFGGHEFKIKYDGDFWRGLRMWSASIGLHCMEIETYDQALMDDIPLYISIGMANSEVSGSRIMDHAVVNSYGQMIFDPNQKTEGLKIITSFIVFTVIDSQRFVKWWALEQGKPPIGIFGQCPVDLMNEAAKAEFMKVQQQQTTQPQHTDAVGFPLGHQNRPHFVTGLMVEPKEQDGFGEGGTG
jgi:hypothetical protein